MDIDEIKRRLAEAGLDTDRWGASKGGSRPAPPSVERARALLENTLQLLQQQVASDQAQISDLHEQVNRLKHGGGS